MLFSAVVNVTKGERELKGMTTGQHIVRDVFCRACEEVN